MGIVSKRVIAGRLRSRIQVDELTGCHVYCGCWSGRGEARMKVGARTYTIRAVVVWLTGRAELWESCYRYRICKTPACANPRHIRVAATMVEGLADMRRRKLFSQHGRNCLTRRRRDCIRALLDEGYTVEEIAEDLKMRPCKIRRAAERDVPRRGRHDPRSHKPRRRRSVVVG